MIKPFKSFSPKPEYVKQIAALPYDVVSTDEARLEIENNKITFLTVDKPEATLEKDIDQYSEKVYKKGVENFDLLNKYFEYLTDEPSFYIYELSFMGNTQTGIAALVSTEDYNTNKIKKHELTRPPKEEDRINHMLSLKAHTGPIFMTYKGNEKVTELLKNYKEQNKPIYDFISKDVTHKVWIITDNNINKKISEYFEKIDSLYIADGHHRAAAASKTHDRLNIPSTENFLAVIFPKDELKILAYNRVIKGYLGFDIDNFIQNLQEKFYVEESKEPVIPIVSDIFGIYISNKWYKISLKKKINDLPVKILTENIIQPILKIEDQRTSDRIDFVGGIESIKNIIELVDDKKWDIGITVCPTTMDQLIEISDQNGLMPPKSTWFEPKLLSGIFINKF
ncbi:MAG: DUF1015 family protein [Defluviitaleaceae bacterium]|nr:DUF1015 family protein [Defluviitaleaceae bacterium]